MRVQRASYEVKFAKLSSEFGERMAARCFTPEQLALIPRLAAGKNKGKMRGVIEWKKVTEGGWHHDAKGGGVHRPGTRDVVIIWTETAGGMSREQRMTSRGTAEDEAASELARKAKIGEALFNL